MKTPVLVFVWLVTLVGAFGVGRFLTDPSSSISQPGAALFATDSGRQGSGSFSDGSASTLAAAGDLPKMEIVAGVSVSTTLREIMDEPNLLKRQPMLAAFMASLTPENIRDALAAFQDADWRDAGTRDAMRMLLYAWGQIDVSGAMEHAQTLDGRYRGFAQAVIVSGWAETDFDSASAWALQQEGRTGQMAIDVLARSLTKTDPKAAADFLSTIPADQVGQRSISSVAEAYAKVSTDGAVEWAQSLPEGRNRAEALEEVAEAWAQTNPVAAAEWVKRTAGDADSTDAGREVAQALARDNPQNALLWADGLPEGQTRLAAQEAAVREWTSADADAAAAWINQLPADANADPYIAGFAKSLARESPFEAADSALAISDDRVRVETVTEVARRWMRSDRDAATQWIASSGLTAAEQAQVTEGANRRGGWGRR